MAQPIKISTVEKLFGNQSMEINPDGTSATVLTDLTKTNYVNLQGLTAVTVSCYINAKAYSSGYIVARAVFFDINDAQLGTHDWVTLSAVTTGFSRFYQTYYLSQSPVPANTVKMKLQFGGIQKTGVNPNFDTFIDGVKVEQGDKLTAYTDYTLKENDSLDLVGDGVIFKKITGVSNSNQVTADSIETAAVTSLKIADGAISTSKIATGAVTTNELGANAVITSKLASGAVTSNELSANAVIDTKIASGAVTTAKIASGAVNYSKLAANSVITSKISAAAVDSSKIAIGAVGINQIAANAVDNTKLADNAVTSSKLQDAVVTNSKIQFGTVAEDRLNNSLTTKLCKLQSDGTFKGDVYSNDGVVKLIDSATGMVTSALQTSSGASLNDRVEAIYTDVYNKDVALPILDRNVNKSLVHGTFKTYRPGTTTADLNIGVIGDSWDDLFELTRADNGEDLLDETGAPIKVVALWGKQSKVSSIIAGNDPNGVGAGWSRTDGDGTTNSTWVELSALPTANFNIVYSIRKKLSTLQTRDLVTVGVIKGGQSDANITGALHDLKGTTNWNDAVPSGRKLTDLTTTKDAGATYIIADGKVKGSSIVAGEVGTTQLADNAVTTSKIPDNAISTQKINSGSVTGDKIAPTTITASNIANSTITGTQIASSTITGSNIASATVTQSNLANNSVGSAQIADANITNEKIANLAVDSTKLTNGAVTNEKIGANAVDSSKLANGAVGTTQLTNLAVDNSKLADASVITSKIANLAVDSTKIADSSVTTVKIAANAVDATKIGSGAVGTTQLANSAVDSTKLANNAVVAGKIATNAVVNGNIADGAITDTKISDGSVTTAKLNATALSVFDGRNMVQNPSFESGAWI